jgi:hypothetical protein
MPGSDLGGTSLHLQSEGHNTPLKSSISSPSADATPKARRTHNYFLSRLQSLGLHPDDAFAHGLGVDQDGSILQFVRNFHGEVRHFIPDEKKKAYLKVRNRKTGTEIHDSHFFSPLTVRRLHPDALAADPTKHKYRNEKGQRVFPIPTNLAIKNYVHQVKGGSIFFIEGYFKALAMYLSGVEAVAFTGISVYRCIFRPH